MDINDVLFERLTRVFRFNRHDLVLQPNMNNGDIDDWTSLSHALLIESLENEFKISFEIDEILTMQSVQDIYESISKKIKHP